MLDQLIEHNHRRGTPMSNDKLREEVIRLMEDEEKNPNVTPITLPPIMFFSHPSL